MKKLILFVLLVAGLCPARSQNPFRVKGGVPAIAVRAADPDSPEAGMLYLNSVTGCVRYYDGSQWINMSCPNQAPNQAPVASNVSQSGTAEVGQALTGTYTYSDTENNPQGTSTYQWYRADNGSGLNETAIGGVTAQTYTLVAADAGKYIRFAVMPVATTGTTPGAETKATAFAGPVTGGVVNQAPVASNVSQSGTAEVGQLLTGTYTYSDTENNPQGTSTYKWYRADNGSGLNETAISGATAQTYTLAAADATKYIRFAVMPVATTGTTPGAEVKATAFAGPVSGGSGNQAPMASNLSVSGTLQSGQVLTGTYTYSDAEDDLEGVSVYRWYRAADASGTGAAAISGANAVNYTLQAADGGKYIRFVVVPRAATGADPGAQANSDWMGPVIVCQNDVSSGSGALVQMLYDMDGNGSAEYQWCAREVSLYGITWLDRNLGAYRVANAIDDGQGYGDYYQWGRDMDGHQNPNSGTTTEISNSSRPGNGLFITSGSNDWCTGLDGSEWWGVNAVNNPCPSGWRVPKNNELDILATNFTDRYDAFDSVLKMPSSGYRSSSGDGGLNVVGGIGQYWSSLRATYLSLISEAPFDMTKIYTYETAWGLPIRCIKD